LHHVLVRREQGATHAQGYARTTGKVGGHCNFGTGATKFVCGIADAQIDSTLWFALQVKLGSFVGSCFKKRISLEFQPSNQMELSNHRGFRNSGDYCKAFFIARSRPGPVLIDITKKCAI
jgi:glyoxylate carboligase